METISIQVELPANVVTNLSHIARTRGVDMPTLIRVAMHSLMRRAAYYDIGTRMGFGKYRDEAIDTIIKCDPGYIRWAVKNLEDFQMSEACWNLLKADEVPPPPPPAPPAPEVVDHIDDFQINTRTYNLLNELGLRSRKAIRRFGKEKLFNLKGVGPRTREEINAIMDRWN